jgi:hypothetical protein
MHARVSTFANRDTNRGEELAATVRERIQPDRFSGANRVLLLVEGRASGALILSFFESEDALRTATRELEALELGIPEPLRGLRVSSEVYEVTVDETSDGARAARMTVLAGDPRRIDEDTYVLRQQIVPDIADVTGWRGIIALANRASGAKRTITFWDSDESLRASDVRATQLGIRAANAMNDSITGVSLYAVAVHEALVAA